MNSILLTFIFAVSMAALIVSFYLEVSWFAEYRRSSREYKRGYSLIQKAMKDAFDTEDTAFLKQVVEIYQSAVDAYNTPLDSQYHLGIRCGYADFYKNLKSEPKRVLIPRPDYKNHIYFLSE